VRTVIVVASLIVLLLTGHGLSERRTDAQLNAIARDFAAAFNAKDAAKVAAFYTDDGVVMAPGRAMVKGRRDIEAYYRRGFEQDVSDLRLLPMESAVSGDHAYESGMSELTYRAGASLLSGPGPATDSGKYVVLYKRVRGEWKISYDIFNSD
jgi:uncharacterized protein (TIGR02246 family)